MELLMIREMRNKGFSTLEYAALIAMFIAALLGISTYLTRAICGKMRSAGDAFGHGRQYTP